MSPELDKQRRLMLENLRYAAENIAGHKLECVNETEYTQSYICSTCGADIHLHGGSGVITMLGKELMNCNDVIIKSVIE